MCRLDSAGQMKIGCRFYLPELRLTGALGKLYEQVHLAQQLLSEANLSNHSSLSFVEIIIN